MDHLETYHNCDQDNRGKMKKEKQPKQKKKKKTDIYYKNK